MKKEKSRITWKCIGFIALNVLDWVMRFALIALFVLLLGIVDNDVMPMWKTFLLSLATICAMVTLGYLDHLVIEVAEPAYKHKIGRMIRRFENRYTQEL